MFKKIVERACWVMLALIVLMSAFVLIASRNGWQFASILSGSMEPNLNVGGLVVARPVPADQLKVGDIVAFHMNGVDTPVAHRIVDVRMINGNLFFQTKGDANQSPDADLVYYRSVSGKIVAHIPYVGRLSTLSQFTREPVSILGRQLPAVVLLVSGMGAILITATLVEMLIFALRSSARAKRQVLSHSEEHPE